MTLRALVIGAGWAGEGHSKALRAAGVESSRSVAAHRNRHTGDGPETWHY
ncbi:MAG: hypothetical protein R2867_32315 [Caldilineaceae bacterium]